MTEEIKSARGGKREGAGRKNQGYKMVSIRMTDNEKEAVKDFLKRRRKETKGKKVISYSELHDQFVKANEEGKVLYGVIVYRQENFKELYSVESRSYEVNSNSNGFKPGKISNAVYGNCVDGTDIGVRLDCYNWEIDYCYLTEK